MRDSRRGRANGCILIPWTCLVLAASFACMRRICSGFNIVVDFCPSRSLRFDLAKASFAVPQHSAWRMTGHASTITSPKSCESSRAENVEGSTAVEQVTLCAEILDALFPPSPTSGDSGSTEGFFSAEGVSYEPPRYTERVQAGREAQGYTVTTDAVAARTLVPIRELTYGEYDLGFFSSLVEECLRLRVGEGVRDRGILEAEARKLCFGDIGSGCGRLVVAQALSWPWRLCHGVEKVPSLHHMGEEALAAAEGMARGETVAASEVGGLISREGRDLLKSMALCSLSCGDVNESEVDVTDMDILFCYSSSFPAYGDLLAEFSYTLGHKLRPGAQVITTDRRLVSDGPWEFALLGEREGPNPETGGKSTAYLWRVVKSAI